MAEHSHEVAFELDKGNGRANEVTHFGSKVDDEFAFFRFAGQL